MTAIEYSEDSERDPSDSGINGSTGMTNYTKVFGCRKGTIWNNMPNVL